MRIEYLRLKNFKVFQDIEIKDIPRFCVLVGANGTGKSIFFDVFVFLKECLTYNITRAFQTRGGFKEVVSRGHGAESIVIELQFRMPISNVERLVTYHLEMGAKGGRPVVEREILRYKRGAYGSPYHFLDFKHGEGYAVINEEDLPKTDEQPARKTQKLDAENVLAIKGLGQFQRFKAAGALHQFIKNWHVSDFHIDTAGANKDAAGVDQHLSVSGDNLQLVAGNLLENHPDIFDHIVKRMLERVPGIDGIKPISGPDGRLLLGFRDGSFKDLFIDKYVSDGTLKMFACLVLLNDPEPHPLLCVENPENQIYPKLLEELAEEFRYYAVRGGQVFVSTHSPDFLNAVRLDEVFRLVKRDGFANIVRAKDNEQIAAFMADGDQMGYLWSHGFFEGADSR